MAGNFTSAGISADELRSIARNAATEYIDSGTPLTDAVVKAASMSGRNLTSEHVRRVCEMAYHDTFEREFRAGSGSDRYVSFDPPDAKIAASRLRSEKVASAQPQRGARSHMNTTVEKTAEAPPRRFKPINAFDELMKTAESAERPPERWNNPVVEINAIRNNLREAVKEAQAKIATLEGAESYALRDLQSYAYQAVKQGSSVPDVLHACLQVATPLDHQLGTSSEVVSKLAEALANYGLPIDNAKIASVGDVNPNHPVPRAFRKVADYRSERAHMELALSDIRADLEHVNEQIRALVS